MYDYIRAKNGRLMSVFTFIVLLSLNTIANAVELEVSGMQPIAGDNPIAGYEIRLAGDQVTVLSFALSEIVDGSYTTTIPAVFNGQTVNFSMRVFDTQNISSDWLDLATALVPSVTPPILSGAAIDITADLSCRDGFTPSSPSYECVAN